MHLVSDDGASVSLRITGYQHPEPDSSTGEFDYDANWLVIAGEVRTSRGVTWSFSDPCLLTTEAADLRDWLHLAADGSFPRYRRREGQALGFCEPNLELNLRHRDERHVTLRFTFAAESRPPAAFKPVSVLIRTDPDALHKAADEWDDELDAYPER